jgi:hypothetical protein
MPVAMRWAVHFLLHFVRQAMPWLATLCATEKHDRLEKKPLALQCFAQRCKR